MLAAPTLAVSLFELSRTTTTAAQTPLDMLEDHNHTDTKSKAPITPKRNS